MSLTLSSANMLLPIPVVGQEPGPAWATDLNNCLTIIDQHDHSAGQGVPISPTGMNINADLAFGGNNITLAKSVRFSPQNSPLSSPSDVGCLYESGVDLYYNDANGNQIRITQSGGISGTPGSISGLTTPASASYVSGSSTFVFQSAVSTPANIDGASFILRNLSASSKGLTLAPPAAMGADYTITLPPLPGSSSIVTMDTSGVLGTISQTGGITLAMLAAAVQAALTPSGTIIAYSNVTPPSGYLLCDGTSYLISSYPALAAACYDSVHTKYAFGSADGTHFNVPDLRGQFMRGADLGAGKDPDVSSRTAMNANGNVTSGIGSIQGYTLQSHTHSIAANNGAGGFQQATTGNNSNTTVNTNATGGNETRPTNAYVCFMIKT